MQKGKTKIGIDFAHFLLEFFGGKRGRYPGYIDTR